MMLAARPVRGFAQPESVPAESVPPESRPPEPVPAEPAQTEAPAPDPAVQVPEPDKPGDDKTGDGQTADNKTADEKPSDEKPDREKTAPGFLGTLSERAHSVLHRGNWVFVPVIMYSKETGFGGGLGVIWLVPSPADRARTSSVDLFAVYTQNNQILTRLSPDFYLDGRNWRLRGEIGFKDFPTRFYGLGNGSPKSNQEHYTPRSVSLSAEIYRRLFRDLYAGIDFDFTHTDITEFEPAGLIAANTVPGSRGGDVSGVGPAVYWDSRDSTFFPTTGGYYRFSSIFYDRKLGGEFGFRQYNFDVRRYFSTFHDQVFALQVLARFSDRSAPLESLPALGGSHILRGIFEGRFIDRHQIVVQGEYRIPFWVFLGASVFGGVGEVADRIDNFDLGGLKYSVGAGLRFTVSVKEHVNLRLDVAKGTDDFGVYLRFREAF